MVKRYELTDAQWQRIAALLPGKAGDPGRTAADNRLFVNGVLWVLRSGAHWHDLPERYGKWKSVHKRFTRWAKAGVWERVFEALTERPQERVPHARHHPGPRPPAGRDRKRGDQNQALGRSRGGLTTKIHMLADALGPAAALHPHRRPGRTTSSHAPALLEGVDGDAVIADKAYDSNALRELIADAGHERRHPFQPLAQDPYPARRRRSTSRATASSAASTSSSTSAASPPATTAEPSTSSPSSTSPAP